MKYCIDTSALIQAWWEAYPPDIFPSLWLQVDQAIENDLIVAPEEVLFELEKKDDDLFKWAKIRRHIFLPLETDIQVAAAEILTRYPRLVAQGKSQTSADSFVIALSLINGFKVVTAEKGGTKTKPKIPFVCDQLKISWTDLLSMIRELGWNF